LSKKTTSSADATPFVVEQVDGPAATVFLPDSLGQHMETDDYELVCTKTPEGRTRILGYRETSPRRVERPSRIDSQVAVGAVPHQSRPREHRPAGAAVSGGKRRDKARPPADGDDADADPDGVSPQPRTRR
jgi:hypothetical protein